MESIIAAIRLVHVAAGTLALVVAPIPMLTAKGGGTHRRWGQVYFWAMAVVALTAVILAVFSFYSAFYGYRALFRKRPREGQGALPLDWTAAVVMLAASAGMAILGIVRPSPAWERVGVVPVVFGVFGIILAGLDFWRFGWPPADRNAWWFAHMQGMLGSYIATVTAFSVVNFTFLPTTVRWLWPIVVGTPLITAWITYYKLAFRREPALSSGRTL